MNRIPEQRRGARPSEVEAAWLRGSRFARTSPSSSLGDADLLQMRALALTRRWLPLRRQHPQDIAAPHLLDVGVRIARVLQPLGDLGQRRNILDADRKEHTSELQSLMRISYAV